MMRRLRGAAGLAAIVLSPFVTLGAQRAGAASDSARANATLPRGAGGLGRRSGAGGRNPANRDALERQVRQALARVTRQRLGLDDSQMSQLTDADRKFQPRRQALTREETQTRVALRAAMADTVKPDQERISGYLDHLAALQRQRIDLQQEEQKTLGGFLTPLQRAQYQALQERMRRRLDQMRPPGGGPAGRRGTPPQGRPPR